MAQRASRIPSLDGWRAIAIILVLLSHEWATLNAPALPRPLFTQGDLGVRIFFVLSGYLITRLLLQEHERTGGIDLRAFYTRRALRILPVYYLYLGVLAAMQWAGLYQDDASSWLGSLTFTRNVVGNGRSATGHLWSLSVEEQFYLLWPITLAMLRLHERRRLAAVILLGLVLAAVAARVIPCDTSGFLCQRVLGTKSAIRYADCLAIGCLAALFPAARLIRPGPLLCGAVAGLVLTAALPSVPPLAASALVTAQALLTVGALLASAVDRGAVGKVLNSPGFVYLGLISYSLYIWHMLFLSHYMGSPLGGLGFYDWRIWWLPALVVATGSYIYYERRITAARPQPAT